VLDAIETDLGVPAVGHLTSELWQAFRTLGIHEPVRGFGKLLAA
jgi:maleate cis-trans isomerase